MRMGVRRVGVLTLALAFSGIQVAPDIPGVIDIGHRKQLFPADIPLPGGILSSTRPKGQMSHRLSLKRFRSRHLGFDVVHGCLRGDVESKNSASPTAIRWLLWSDNRAQVPPRRAEDP